MNDPIWHFFSFPPFRCFPSLIFFPRCCCFELNGAAQTKHEDEKSFKLYIYIYMYYILF
jgi:hypothetical protein